MRDRKKKVNIIIKKKPHKSTKKKLKNKMPKVVQKIMVGEDEFCPTCMEWRAYNETTGKCLVCGCQIKKVGPRSRTISEEYDLKDFANEPDEQPDSGEY